MGLDKVFHRLARVWELRRSFVAGQTFGNTGIPPLRCAPVGMTLEGEEGDWSGLQIYISMGAEAKVLSEPKQTAGPSTAFGARRAKLRSG